MKLNNKEMRGDILNILSVAFPASLTLGYVKGTLDKLGYDCENEYVQTECSYLEQKGYLTSDKRGTRQFGTTKIMYAITAKGIDLKEGSINDNGVELNE